VMSWPVLSSTTLIRSPLTIRPRMSSSVMLPALRRIVKPAVGVFLDQAFLGHDPQCTSGLMRCKKEATGSPDRAQTLD